MIQTPNGPPKLLYIYNLKPNPVIKIRKDIQWQRLETLLREEQAGVLIT
jgi:hypothetical protein